MAETVTWIPIGGFVLHFSQVRLLFVHMGIVSGIILMMLALCVFLQTIIRRLHDVSCPPVVVTTVIECDPPLRAPTVTA